MIGIYKFTNKINNQIYIGKSIDIDYRIKQHFQNAFRNTKGNKEYNKPLYQAIRKYGSDSFLIEIIEECAINQLNEREKYWIDYYDSYKNGYNCTIGGDGIKNNQGELHPKTKLTNEDVYKIREFYNQHYDQKDIFQQYKHLIGESGFRKIWNGYTWKEVHMDVYTEENKKYYLYKRNSHSENNSHAKLTEQDVINIRTRKKNGESFNNVQKDYPQLTKKSLYNVWQGYNWKQVII